METVGYDAFGKPRNVDGTPDATFGAPSTEPRAYINQEMLPEVLMQVLAGTYEQVIRAFPDLEGADLTDPADSIAIGSAALQLHIQFQGGNVIQGLAHYGNAGFAEIIVSATQQLQAHPSDPMAVLKAMKQ